MLFWRQSNEGMECRDYHSLKPNSTCDYIRTVDDCKFDDGLFDYLKFTFCLFGEKQTWLPMILLALWLFFLFYALAITSDAFFCPSLQVVSKSLGLSENIAGVTFLAFGNGSPDLFSAIAAIGKAKGGDAGLAFGAIVGAGLFVSTVVAGTISMVCPFQSMQRPLLRDLIFLIASSYWVFTIIWNGRIGLFETFGFISMYVAYIFSVLGGRFFNLRLFKEAREEKARKRQAEALTTSSLQAVSVELKDRSEMVSVETASSHPVKKYSRFIDIKKALRPFSLDEWHEAGIIGKITLIIKIPITYMLKLTIPLVNEEVENNAWNKFLLMINLLIAPTFIVFTTDIAFFRVDEFMPIWIPTMGVSLVLCTLALVFTKWQKAPKYQWLISYLGFIVSVMWIYTIANEIVHLLTIFGILFNLSNTILGLTFLAWGNSLPDFVSNVVSARQGQAKMGISACYGGPVFNILLGIGIPFTIACLKSGTILMKKSLLQDVLCLFLGISLVSTLIFIPLNKFNFTRVYGIYLIVLYLIAIAICILIESGVIS